MCTRKFCTVTSTQLDLYLIVFVVKEDRLSFIYEYREHMRSYRVGAIIIKASFHYHYSTKVATARANKGYISY